MIPGIEFAQADLTHVESLKTILARSFHRISEYVRETLPDNSEMREWWGKVYEGEIANPACHGPIIAIDTTTANVVGVACLRRVNAGDRLGGLFTDYEPWPKSSGWHLVNECELVHEEKVMQGAPHFLLNLLLVDHEYQGRGIGRVLMQHVCDIADEARLPTFFLSSAAKDFYVGLGMGFAVIAEPEYKGLRPGILLRSVPEVKA